MQHEELEDLIKKMQEIRRALLFYDLEIEALLVDSALEGVVDQIKDSNRLDLGASDTLHRAQQNTTTH